MHYSVLYIILWITLFNYIWSKIGLITFSAFACLFVYWLLPYFSRIPTCLFLLTAQSFYILHSQVVIHNCNFFLFFFSKSRSGWNGNKHSKQSHCPLALLFLHHTHSGLYLAPFSLLSQLRKQWSLLLVMSRYSRSIAEHGQTTLVPQRDFLS